MSGFSEALKYPLSLSWTPYTIKFILGSLALYVCAIGLYYSTRTNRRPGEEHGSARWGNPSMLNKKYRDPDPSQNLRRSRRLE